MPMFGWGEDILEASSEGKLGAVRHFLKDREAVKIANAGGRSLRFRWSSHRMDAMMPCRWMCLSHRPVEPAALRALRRHVLAPGSAKWPRRCRPAAAGGWRCGAGRGQWRPWPRKGSLWSCEILWGTKLRMARMGRRSEGQCCMLVLLQKFKERWV